MNHVCKVLILVKIRPHVGVGLGFVCSPVFSAFFSLSLLPISQRTVFLSVLPGRLLLSNKPDCRIRVFFLAFENVKIVKLLNAIQMKLLGMKFSKRTMVFVTCYGLQTILKENPTNHFIYSLKKEAAPTDCVDKCLVCSVSLLIMRAKPVKLSETIYGILLCFDLELTLTARICRQVLWLSCVLVFEIRVGFTI